MLHSDMMEFSRALQRVGCGIVLLSSGALPQRPGRPQNNEPSLTARKFHNVRVRGAILSTAQETGVSVDEILGRSRKKKIVNARYQAIRAVARAVDLKRSCGNWAGGFWSTKAIAHLFDRDHTTICYALGTLTGKCSKRGRP